MGAPPGEVGIGWMVTLQFGLDVQAEINDEWHSSWVSTGTVTRSLLVTWNSGTVSSEGIGISVSSVT